ncbi:hypothetical protein ACIRL3_46485 [Streptomyces sp. NPDC102384]|uniref:hypothetical protein n=1 Tax=Streptomyces sp. NPDC102384 TaxID=3366166 RepID=UPI0037FC7844
MSQVRILTGISLHSELEALGHECGRLVKVRAVGGILCEPVQGPYLSVPVACLTIEGQCRFEGPGWGRL